MQMNNFCDFCNKFTSYFFVPGTILTTFVIWEERKNSLSWLSGQQFCGSIGSMIGPLIVRPFLAEQNHSQALSSYYGYFGSEYYSDELLGSSLFGARLDTYKNSSMPLHSISEIAFDAKGISEQTEITNDIVLRNGTSTNTEVMYGYLIAGSIGLTVSTLLLIGYFALGGIHFETRSADRNVTNRTQRTCLHYVIMVILVLCNVVFGSLTRNYISFIVAYAVNHLHWTKSEGAYLASVMSIAGAVSKICCVYLVRIIKLELQLFTGVFMCFGASLLLFFLADYYYFIPWLVTVLYMVGLTQVNSTVFGWIDKVLVMRGVVGVLWNVGGCMGEIIAPFILGYLFQHVSYVAFTYHFVTCTSLVVLCWISLHLLGLCARVRVDEPERDLLINA